MRTKEQYRIEVAERRREAKENGFCVQCFTREAMPDHVLCGRCAELQSDSKARGRLRRRTAMKPRRTRKHTIKPERVVDPEHCERVRALPCIACIKAGMVQASPTEGHHIRRMPDGSFYGAHEKAGDHEMIPLCRGAHHWNGAGAPMSHRAFEAEFGNELDLLAIVNAWLERDVWIINNEAEPVFVTLAEALGYTPIKIGGTAA